MSDRQTLDCLREQGIPGQVQGLSSYPPLHAVCARRDPSAIKVRNRRFGNIHIMWLYIHVGNP